MNNQPLTTPTNLPWIEGEQDMKVIQDIISGIRNIRNKFNIKPQIKLKALCNTTHKFTISFAELEEIIKYHANLSSFIISIKDKTSIHCFPPLESIQIS